MNAALNHSSAAKQRDIGTQHIGTQHKVSDAVAGAKKATETGVQSADLAKVADSLRKRHSATGNVWSDKLINISAGRLINISAGKLINISTGKLVDAEAQPRTNQ
jgi:hypothetical protein